jgi:hypothetical protein
MMLGVVFAMFLMKEGSHCVECFIVPVGSVRSDLRCSGG